MEQKITRWLLLLGKQGDFWLSLRLFLSLVGLVGDRICICCLRGARSSSAQRWVPVVFRGHHDLLLIFVLLLFIDVVCNYRINGK